MKEEEFTSCILEEFKLFTANCTASLSIDEEHQESMLLDGCLLLLCFHFAPHVLLESVLGLLIK
jgi:hypothetical protein